MDPVIVRFKTVALEKSYWSYQMHFCSTWNNLLKHCISVDFLLVEGYLKGAPRKELRIAPFVQRFKTASLGRSYWWILPVLGIIYINIGFLPNVCWWKVMYRVLYKKGCTLFLSYSALKQLLLESIPDSFYRYFKQNA